MNLEKDLRLKQEEFVISSRIISERFEKEHSKVVLKIKELIEGIVENGDTPNSYFISNKYIEIQNGQEYDEFLLTESGFSLLVMGFTGSKAFRFKLDYIMAFQKMRKALADIQFKIGDKKHQIECMSILQDLLPEELKKDKVNYIKANTVVNKITSGYFGLPKLISKIDMNKEMLSIRQSVLDDYIKLYDIFNDNHLVTESLEKKYNKLVLDYSNDTVI